jgi:hypothetical protein
MAGTRLACGYRFAQDDKIQAKSQDACLVNVFSLQIFTLPLQPEKPSLMAMLLDGPQNA